jgi:hypothetical protein
MIAMPLQASFATGAASPPLLEHTIGEALAMAAERSSRVTRGCG